MFKIIIVTAKCELIENKKQEFIELAEELIKATRNEKGCISYILCEDIKEENILVFVEQWESQEALDGHMKSKHFIEIVPRLNKFKKFDSEIDSYKVV